MNKAPEKSLDIISIGIIGAFVAGILTGGSTCSSFYEAEIEEYKAKIEQLIGDNKSQGISDKKCVDNLLLNSKNYGHTIDISDCYSE